MSRPNAGDSPAATVPAPKGWVAVVLIPTEPVTSTRRPERREITVNIFVHHVRAWGLSPTMLIGRSRPSFVSMFGLGSGPATEAEWWPLDANDDWIDPEHLRCVLRSRADDAVAHIVGTLRGERFQQLERMYNAEQEIAYRPRRK